MPEKDKGALTAVFSNLWKGLNLFRTIVLNIVFFVILYYVLSFIMHDTRPEVPDSTALVVTPRGALVEELRWVKPSDSIERMLGMSGSETLLKDLVDAIDAAADDTRVKVLVLHLNSVGGTWLTKLQDLGAAIKRFKKNGKKVIATADNYNRNSYYIAAHADEIYLHHMGIVLLEGYGRFRRYFKEGLDKLDVDMNVFRVGKYKSAVEPYLRNKMSDNAREANLRWLNTLWDIYLNEVSAARGIDLETLKGYGQRFAELLEESGGDTAAMARKAGLVDHVVSRDKVRQRLIELVGENEQTRSYNRISHNSYLQRLKTDRWGDGATGDVVAVVVAKGSIMDGWQPPGNIGGDSTAALLRSARQDKNVKAIVLKVDSGGGSAFASEVIRREMELARQDGIPVVASMGSVAASGGYWISMAADHVWAYPATITGSIGIFGMVPTFQKTLKKHLGVTVDGVGTNPLTGVLRFDRAMSKQAAKAFQLGIDNGYQRFITLVANARNKKPEDIHEVAQGRVWSGRDAKNLGLVDSLGGFSDALKDAATRAKLGDGFKVKYFYRKPAFKDRILNTVLSRVNAGSTAHDVAEKQEIRHRIRPLNPFTRVLHVVIKQLTELSRFNDPKGIYAYCPEVVVF